jgi:hypothetical protein
MYGRMDDAERLAETSHAFGARRDRWFGRSRGAGFPRKGRSCAVAVSAVLLVIAGCGTARGHAAGVNRSPSKPSSTRALRARQVKRADFLTGVACASAHTCVAVGWYYYGTAGPSLALAARWNGRAWLTEPIPSRGRDSSLQGVSCASATSCIAVGARAEAWTGTRWTMIHPAAAMSSVFCVAPDLCVAVGPPPYGRAAVAARWDGRSWQAEPVPEPTPAPQNLALTGISCTSARFCMAIGDYTRGAGARPSPAFRDRTLAEAWNGSRWRILRTQNPSRQSELRSVSCTSSRACTAVGSSAAGQWTLVERWNGRRWAIQPTPNVSRIGYSALTAVSCASSTACTAVGTYDLGVLGIAEQWNGTRWAIQRLPTPPGAPREAPDVVPASVSCASATACMTVGTTENMTLAERWNGSRWTIQPTPNPD